MAVKAAFPVHDGAETNTAYQFAELDLSGFSSGALYVILSDWTNLNALNVGLYEVDPFNPDTLIFSVFNDNVLPSDAIPPTLPSKRFALTGLTGTKYRFAWVCNPVTTGAVSATFTATVVATA